MILQEMMDQRDSEKPDQETGETRSGSLTDGKLQPFPGLSLESLASAACAFSTMTFRYGFFAAVYPSMSVPNCSANLFLNDKYA